MEKKMLSFIADLKRKISDLSKDDKEKTEEKETENDSNIKVEEEAAAKEEAQKEAIEEEAADKVHSDIKEEKGEETEEEVKEVKEEILKEIIEEEAEEENKEVEEVKNEVIEEEKEKEESKEEIVEEKREEPVEQEPERELEAEEEQEQDEDMGKCCSCIKTYDTLEEEVPEEGKTAEGGNDFEEEKTILMENIMESEMVKSCCIVSFPSGQMRANFPDEFLPNKEGIQYVIEGFQGKPENLIEHGISLGCNLPNITPGSYDEGEALYSIDEATQIGCAVVKTNHCLLFVIFEGQLAPACRLASETGKLMKERGL